MTAPYYQDDLVTLHHGDCLDVLRTLPDSSVHAVCTDPPYGLEFMGREWDSFGGGRAQGSRGGAGDRGILPGYGRGGTSEDRFAFRQKSSRAFGDWCEQWAIECLRVLKPGGHMLAFGGSRTWHRLAAAVEDAGFEIRDSIAWLYGSGFPKSLDVSKAIDKAAGAERVASGERGNTQCAYLDRGETCPGHEDAGQSMAGATVHSPPTAPATPEAAQWQGWGTALKPSHEPVVVARKPHVISGILDGIGSELTRLEGECRRSASGAARSSAPTPADSPEARTATAPDSAATPHEGEQEPTTPTGAAAGSSAQTATSWSDETATTPWSTVSSWRKCWAELCELTSTSTTSTTTGPTTDLQTLWSSISSLTVTSTPDSPTPALTSPSTASAVDSLFAATVLRLRATLALSATESATASTPHVPQGAGGSSAFEPIVVARKPLAGTVAANVLEYGTGALNITATRVDGKPRTTHADGNKRTRNDGPTMREGFGVKTDPTPPPDGRWPTNVVLDDTQAAELDKQSGPAGSNSTTLGRSDGTRSGSSDIFPKRDDYQIDRRGYDSRASGAGASRFFPTFRYEAKAPTDQRPRVNGIAHPTVKPLDLMRWLVRLVTPPGGTVLEPFAGSGTTAEACVLEGFKCIAIEREADYLPLIRARLTKPLEPVLDLGGIA